MLGKKGFNVNLDVELWKNFDIKCSSESMSKGEVITQMVQNFVKHGKIYLNCLDENLTDEDLKELKAQEQSVVEQTEEITGKKIDESSANLSAKERDRLLKIFALCRSNADFVMKTNNELDTTKNDGLFDKTEKFVKELDVFAHNNVIATVVNSTSLLFGELQLKILKDEQLRKSMKLSINNLDMSFQTLEDFLREKFSI